MRCVLDILTRVLIPVFRVVVIAVVTASMASAEVAWQSNGVPVCTLANSQESPYIVSTGSGETIIVWADTRDFDYDIYAQKLDADGHQVWAAGGVKICEAIYDQQFPAAVDDGAGGAIIVWQDGRLGDDGLALYAQRVLPNGIVAWQTDGLPVCSYASGLADPPMAFSHVVTSDGSGGVIAAWRDTRNDPIAGNTEIYAQRVDGNGAAKWTTNGVKILGFGTQKWSTRNPVVAPDGSGGVVVVWQDARTLATTGNDLYAQHVTAVGTPTWTSNGVVVCNAIGDQGYPDIMPLAGGATAIVWEDKRSGNYDVYAQQFNASGSPQWGANGRMVCSSANDQRTPRVCSDGAGGATIAWTDKRSSTVYTDVFAQRLDASGSALWGDQGTAVCTAAGSQTRVRMCPSVSGLTIRTWMDTRNETLSALYDLYGQMIDSSAAPKWAAAGIPVAAITGNNQRMQQVTSDGGGSLCAVWEDDRNAGDWDIYAQKLSPWIAVSNIAEAKSRPGGTPISIPARVVTGSFSGCFYIEETDRFAGIRVEYPQVFTPGSMLIVSGTLDFGLEPFIRASVVEPAGTSDVPGTLGITASRLGSTSIGEISGLTNVGLLVRTWGRVVSKPATDQPYLILTDGARDVRAYCNTEVEVGDAVVATGVCSGESTSSGVVVTLLTRNASDVRRVSR